MEFEALYGSYAQRLRGWALRRTAGPADAEDLTQDAFLAIYCSLPGLRGEAGLDAWVFGVARNVWRGQLRARARRKRAAPRISLDDVAPEELVDPRTPSDAVELGRALERLDAEARRQLGPETWECLVDYALERTDLDALEAATGFSREALKSRLSRARRRLQQACPELAPG